MGIASPFPNKFKFSINMSVDSATTLNFDPVNDGGYQRPSETTTTTFKVSYESAPLLSDNYSNDDIALAASWPEGIRAKAGKDLRVDRVGYDVYAEEDVKYYTLDNNKAFIIKGVGGTVSNMPGAVGPLTPTSTVVIGDQTIKNIGYAYQAGATGPSGASGASGPEELGQRKYGSWNYVKISDNQAAITNTPIATTLANLADKPGRSSWPCFGCIPMGYLGAANAQVTPPVKERSSVVSQSYFGGASDLAVGDYTVTGPTPDSNYSKKIFLPSQFDGFHYYNYYSISIYWLDAENKPIGAPIVGDPFWSSYNIYKRSMLSPKWSGDLTTKWPYDSFQLDETYYIVNAIPVERTSTQQYQYDYSARLYGGFDKLIGIFSRPFKNPFSTPSSAFCESIYKANKEAYLKNPYSLVIGAYSGSGMQFKFEIDPETGFPQKTGKFNGLVINPDATTAGWPTAIIGGHNIGYSWDGGSPTQTFHAECDRRWEYYHDGHEGSSYVVITPCLAISSVSVHGTCTLDYDIA
jgi:hypothetical protein